MSILSIQDCENYINKLKLSLEKSWIENNLQKINDYFKTKNNKKELGPIEQFHPLARNLHAAILQLSRVKSERKLNSTTDMITVAMLGHSISVLKEAKCEGIDEKILELMLPNFEQFSKTCYELHVGEILQELNHQVKFLIEQKHRSQTPDILLDSQVEVECKRKDIKTPRDNQNEFFFNQIPEKFKKIICNKNLGYLIIIKTRTDPTQEIIDNISNKLHELISLDKTGTFSIKNAEIQIKKILEYTENIDVGFVKSKSSNDMMTFLKNLLKRKTNSNDMFDWIMKKAHHYVFDHKITIQHNGHGSITAVAMFAFESIQPPDRLTSVINSIKKGKNQLSGNLPGMIFVDMEYKPESIVNDYQRLEPMIQNMLANNSRISAVVVTVEVHLNENNQIHYYYDGKIFVNSTPKNPLPKKFKIFETVQSPVYHPIKIDQDLTIENTNPKNVDASIFSYICINCKNKHDIQVNLVPNIPLQDGFKKFPIVDNLSICSTCGIIKDLSETRETIEKQTGKKIVE